jgi:hypothetical protein
VYRQLSVSIHFGNISLKIAKLANVHYQSFKKVKPVSSASKIMKSAVKCIYCNGYSWYMSTTETRTIIHWYLMKAFFAMTKRVDDNEGEQNARHNQE